MESELLAKMETLKSVHVSWMLDQDEIVQKRDDSTGRLVYDMPTGETVIGSDPRQCRVKVAGISISSEVCT